jgi:hypothetical protein
MKKKNELERRKNEEPDEKNAVGSISAGNCFWVCNNDCGLQEESRPSTLTERDPQKEDGNTRVIQATQKQNSVRPERLLGLSYQ